MNVQRRQFLAIGTALILGRGATGGGLADASRARGMALGFSTYGMRSLASERAIQAIAGIGFDSIELCVTAGWDADSAKLGQARRSTLRRQVRDAGLRLTSLMEHLHPENEELQANALERLKLAAKVAHDLAPEAPPIVQTTLGGGTWERVRSSLRDRLGKWVEVATATDLLIAIKPHRGGAVSQPADAVWLIEQLGRPARLRMVYDYSHYIFRDLSMEATAQTALPYTIHVAVKDAVQDAGRVAFRLAGQAGTIDYPRLLGLLAAGGYERDVNCEVSGMLWNQPDYDPLVAAATCYANMARAFEQAGIVRSKRTS